MKCKFLIRITFKWGKQLFVNDYFFLCFLTSSYFSSHFILLFVLGKISQMPWHTFLLCIRSCIFLLPKTKSTWEDRGSLRNCDQLFIPQWIWHLTLVAQQVKNLPAMQETWVESLGQEDPLEKGMATHSSILACRICGQRSLGRLTSIRSQRVGHNWRTNTFTYCYLQRLANGINHLPEQESDSCAASHEALGCKADQQKPRQTRERNLASLLIKMLSTENSIFQCIWCQQHLSQLFPSSLLSS